MVVGCRRSCRSGHRISLRWLVWLAVGFGAQSLIKDVFNGFFILLHLAQTHVTYDGLAQDTPEIRFG